MSKLLNVLEGQGNLSGASAVDKYTGQEILLPLRHCVSMHPVLPLHLLSGHIKETHASLAELCHL